MQDSNNSDTSLPETNFNTIHVGMDISHSCIRYAIGRKSKNENKPVEILGIHKYPVNNIYNESSLLSAVNAITEEALMEFAIRIQITDVCVSANEINVLFQNCSEEILKTANSDKYEFEKMYSSVWDALIEDCSESLFKVMSVAEVDIKRIEIVGDAASRAVISEAQRQNSCLFLDIRKNGSHIHIYNSNNVYRHFLAHKSDSSEWGEIAITSTLERVKELLSGYTINETIITGEFENSQQIIPLAQSIFLIPCHIGIPSLYAESTLDVFNGHDLSEMIQSPEYAAVIGLLINSSC